MTAFIKKQDSILQKLLNHIGTSAIADLVLKLIAVEELPEGAGTIQVSNLQYLPYTHH